MTYIPARHAVVWPVPGVLGASRQRDTCSTRPNQDPAIPIKFSLGSVGATYGAERVGMCPAGEPASRVDIVFGRGTFVDAIEETVTAGGNSLTYDATTGQYIYVWKTGQGGVGRIVQAVRARPEGWDAPRGPVQVHQVAHSRRSADTVRVERRAL
jgi:hypothetical protein